MKRIITALFATFLLYAGKASATELVPVYIMQSFFETFTNAQNVKWETRNGFNIASFTRNGIDQSAVYNEEGKLLTVARQVFEKEISNELRSDLQKRFEGFYFTTLFEMKDDAGTSYFATITNGSSEKILKAERSKWIVVDSRRQR